MNKARHIYEDPDRGIRGEVVAPDLDPATFPQGFGLDVGVMDDPRLLSSRYQMGCRFVELVERFGFVRMRIAEGKRAESPFWALDDEWNWQTIPKGISVDVPHVDDDSADTFTMIRAFREPSEDRYTGLTSLPLGTDAVMAHIEELRGHIDDGFIEALSSRKDMHTAWCFRKMHTLLYQYFEHPLRSSKNLDIRVSRPFVDRVQKHLREGVDPHTGVGPRSVQHQWHKGDMLFISNKHAFHYRGKGDPVSPILVRSSCSSWR